MGLEQSLNRDSKTSGGIVGFTLKQRAVDRWFLTAHEKSSIAAATKIMCEHHNPQPNVAFAEADLRSASLLPRYPT